MGVRSHRIVSLTLGCDSQHNYEKNLIKPSWSADGSKVGCGSSDRAVCCAPNRSPVPSQSTEPCGTAARTVAPTVSALMLRMAQWPCVCCSVVSRGFTHPHGSHPQSSSSASENVSPVRLLAAVPLLLNSEVTRDSILSMHSTAVEPRFTVRTALSCSRCSLSHCLWQVYVWDTTSRNLLYKLPGHRGSVNGTESLQH